MKALWLECNCGVSMKLLIAALLDLGADLNKLDDVLKSLPEANLNFTISRKELLGINCCVFSLLLSEERDSICHERDYISKLIDNADMSPKARESALKILKILLKTAESRDNFPVETVFTIRNAAYIIALAVCLDSLNLDEVIVTELCEGHGPVYNDNAVWPVPSIAVTSILETYKIKVNLLPVHCELITILGAAAIAGLRTTEKLPLQFKIIGSGFGAEEGEEVIGKFLRAIIVETDDDESKQYISESICKLETDIDDCSGEVLGYTLERLLAAGALDAHFLPVYMKKNRPGWQLQVICKKETVRSLEAIIFAETTTIGIRRVIMSRTALPRRTEKINTIYGPVAVKVCGEDNDNYRYVEYASAAALAKEKGIPLADIYKAVFSELGNSHR